jgi:Gpi18-like mannosyltransferase
VKYELTGKITHVILHLLFFTLALLTKETAILLPLVFVFIYFKYNRLNYRWFLLLLFWISLLTLSLWLRSRVIDQLPITTTDYFSGIKKFSVSFIIGIGKAIWA